MSKKIEKAMSTLKKALIEDPDYAHSWYCNLKMAFYDASGPVETGSCDREEQLRIGSEGAIGFMSRAFDVKLCPHGQLMDAFCDPCGRTHSA